MWKLVLVVAVPALVLAVAPTGVSGEGETPFRIAYISFPGTPPGGELCVADISTEGWACLEPAREGIDLMDLSWSPDGTMIAVNRWFYPPQEVDVSDVLVVAADGSRTLSGGQPSPLRLGADLHVRGIPMWSPDGGRIAMIDMGSQHIVIMDVGSGSHELIAPQGVSGIFALDAIDWSPDGETFVLGAIMQDGDAAVLRVDADTGSSTPLMEFAAGSGEDAGSINDVTWSNDGTKVLFTRTPSPPQAPWSGSKSEHWIIDGDGTDARKLYDSPRADGAVMAAAFSPDGRTVLFEGYSGDVINLFLIAADGTDMRKLTASAAGAYNASWWPHADTHILYFDSETTTLNIATTGSLGDAVEVRHLTLLGRSVAWAPATGTLPPDLVLPTPVAQSTPLSPPPASDATASPAGATPPVPGGGVTPPDTGGGGGRDGGGRPGAWYLLTCAVLLLGTGGAVLLRAR